MENSYQVVIIDAWRGHYVETPDLETEILGPYARVSLLRVNSHHELVGQIENADVVISWHTVPLPAEIITRLQKCKGIVRAAVGFDNIDIVYAANRGIAVCNVPDYGTEEVADHTFALLLASVRRIKALDEHVRNGGWDWRTIGRVPRLRDTNLGIVGMGRIGTAVARRAQAFGMNVGFYDPYISDGMDKALCVRRFENLEELLINSQIISLHVPLSDETKHMIGRHEFKLMKNAILINTARGNLIDHTALIEALESDALSFVALDVLSDEPEIPFELRESDKVLLTPHVAFYSDAVMPELRRKAAQAALRFLLDQPQRCIVNGALLKTTR
ncbi:MULTISPECIES: C-terminal binding protein [Alicyclobacillus]|nr:MULTISPECIES: C-terminal binding protein [Alicyclobacillus]